MITVGISLLLICVFVALALLLGVVGAVLCLVFSILKRLWWLALIGIGLVLAVIAGGYFSVVLIFASLF